MGTVFVIGNTFTQSSGRDFSAPLSASTRRAWTLAWTVPGSCTISSLMASGMRRHWSRNCSFRPIALQSQCHELLDQDTRSWSGLGSSES